MRVSFKEGGGGEGGGGEMVRITLVGESVELAERR